MIGELKTDREITECTAVIQSAFTTVARDLNLTKENAPSHPSFMTEERLKSSLEKGLTLFGLSENGQIIGCVGIEKSRDSDELFFIERLAVLPESRHKGFGKELMDFAFNKIREKGGKRVSIGIINEQKILKDWYSDYGFKETSVKTFPHLPFTVCFMEKEV